MTTPRRPQVVVILGPTASGKTGLGIAVAKVLDGVVINADSMQLYKGMDIGTAKVTDAERDGVPHLMLDIWSPTREASVADYQTQTRDLIDSLLAQGTSAVIVGGAGLYIRGVLDDLQFPGTDIALRARLTEEIETIGQPAMHARLAALDPAAAASIPQTNSRRIVRALEVISLTGQPFSTSLPSYGPARWDAAQIGLDPPVDALDERIRARVERMWAAGMVDEVRSLRESPGLGVTARRALGYAQVIEWLDGGAIPAREAAAKEATVIATRRFARRQRSWFRRDPRITWLPTEAILDSYRGAPDPLIRAALAAIHPFATKVCS